MKLAIIGSSGFVGSCLFDRLKEEHAIFGISSKPSSHTTNECDIRNKRSLDETLDSINPDVIIDSIKLRKSIDYYESNKKEASELHVSGARNIAGWAGTNGKKIIYLSTDYVYPGETNDYDENSETRPLNVYGGLKLESENIIAQSENHAILRTTVVFDYLPGDVNFLMKILNTKEKRRVPFDQISSPTSINVLTDYVRGIIERDGRGLFVASGRESIGRYDFTLMIADVFGLDKGLFIRTSTSELDQIAKRPLDNALISSKIRHYLNYDCPTIRDSLEEIKRRI